MARGGYRPGAGRPKGATAAKTAAKKTPAKKRATKAAKPAADVPQDVADDAAASGMTPLEFMLQIMRDDDREPADRMRMAVAAAPFVHPRAGETKPGKKDQQQDAASKVAAKSKFAPAAPPLKLVRP